MSMGSSNSAEKDLKGGAWTACLHFYTNNGEWKQLQSHEIIDYFRDELQAEQATIISSEIRKYALSWWIPPLVGNWHEYTLVETTNGHWSFEKNSKGIFVQRGETRDDVRRYYGSQERNKDKTEGRSARVSFKENILDVAKWILNRNELGNTYHVFQSNCHFFASLLYEAITRTKGQRRLSNTE